MPEVPVPDDLWDAPFIVAVSGGIDSVALLHLLSDLPGRLPVAQFHVAHFDHQWSPSSNQTVDFVNDLATRWQWQFHSQTAGQLCQENGWTLTGNPPRLPHLGPEATARQLRYQYFHQLAESLNARYLLTAHSQDDQIETILMRILRGTSVEGLAGIPKSRPFTEKCTLLRPLLDQPRRDLKHYLQQHGVPYKDDPSNQDTSITRNLVRLQILPWLQQHSPHDVAQNLLRLGQSAQDWHAIWQHCSPALDPALIQLSPGQFQVDVRQLSDWPEPMVRQKMVHWWQQADLPLQEMNRQQWQALTSLAVRPCDATKWPSQHHFPGHVVAQRSQGTLTVRHSDSERTEFH